MAGALGAQWALLVLWRSPAALAFAPVEAGRQAVNLPPIANDDSLVAFTDSGERRLDVLRNDADPESGVITITAASAAANGSTAITFNNLFVSYTPNDGFSGTDAFTYTVADTQGLTGTARVTVTVGTELATALPFDMYGGGLGGSVWFVRGDGGTSNGLPSGGSWDASPGLTLSDAELGYQNVFPQDDAYDGAALWVNGQIIPPPSTVTVTQRDLTAGPTALSGLNVTVQYATSAVTATLRTLISFHNPTSSAIPLTATWAVNFGSDDRTGVRGTSSGDMVIGAGDRWVITSDDPAAPADPVNTLVLFGPGNPIVTPSLVTDTVFENGGTQGLRAEFRLNIPAGATRRLMFFSQLHPANEAALAAAALFDVNPTPGSDLLAGLGPTELSEIANWAFASSAVYLPIILR